MLFSNCKINLGLHITAKRPDGFHNIETVFYPLPLYDALELFPASQTGLFLYGLPIPGNKENNIILKAYQLIKNQFPKLPPVAFHLLKNIPAGAGLGAGSANGATALIGLNQLFELKLSQKQLLKFALQLGSDCPFFIINQPCYATGRGEELFPISLDLKKYSIVIVNPGIHISTPWAFGKLKPASPHASLKSVEDLPLNDWKTLITNDFERVVFETHPEIETIKQTLLAEGACFALMTGTGSTVFGLFEQLPSAFSFPPHYFLKIIPPAGS